MDRTNKTMRIICLPAVSRMSYDDETFNHKRGARYENRSSNHGSAVLL